MKTVAFAALLLALFASLAAAHLWIRVEELAKLEPQSDDSREFAAARLDGKVRLACKYETRAPETGVLTCWYRKPAK